MPKLHESKDKRGLQQLDQAVDLFLGGGPAGDKTHGGVLRIRLVPEAHLDLFREGSEGCLIQQDEVLVGRGIKSEGIALVAQRLTDALGRGDGGTPDLSVEIVGEERVELQARHKTLCKDGTVLLDDGEEIRDRVVLRENQCFTQQRAALGPADVEHIAETGEVRQGHIVLRAGEGIGQAGSVHIEAETLFPADSTDGFFVIMMA